MDEKSQKVIRTPSQINYNYATIGITQSRLDKGLLALPVSVSNWFPKANQNIEVYLNDSPTSQIKNYSSYSSSTRECRIGGLKQWFQQNNIATGDEIVIQLIDKDKYIYRLIPERNFVLNTKELQIGFDSITNEEEAKEKILTLSNWTNTNQNEVELNEYTRLISNQDFGDRQYVDKISSRARESVPANIRTLLGSIYKGHCQVCDFWFLKKDKEPYFEIHHLDKSKGHHPKNLVVVCGNCHNQFEHASIRQEFNSNLWLAKVQFNDNIYPLKNIMVDKKPRDYYKESFI